jgi:hypothetical protein
MKGVKFSRKENPEDKHDKEGKEEGHDPLSGPRKARVVCQVPIIGTFVLLISLILTVQKSELL